MGNFFCIFSRKWPVQNNRFWTCYKIILWLCLNTSIYTIIFFTILYRIFEQILFHLLVVVRSLLLLESMLSNSIYCCFLQTFLTWYISLFTWYLFCLITRQYFQSIIISWFYYYFSFLKLLCLLWRIDASHDFFIEKTIFLKLFEEYTYKRYCT